jgi:Alpha amylase, catalytic domain
MATAPHPLLYQVNTRVWLAELSASLGRRATLDDVPNASLDRLAACGCDWLWPLGIWQIGAAGRAGSRANAAWREEFKTTLPELTDEDICGSPFAIVEYAADRDFGGNEALNRLRRRLADRGVRLMLDFVPNHTAIDHPWVATHPEFYIGGTEDDLAREPANYCRLPTPAGPRVFAFGRDPNYPGWPDVLQLNYRHPGPRTAMADELLKVVGLCDGVRCDMAMLLLPEIIHRSWGDRSLPADGAAPVDAPFWPDAIARVRSKFPEFKFMAEVYWDLEWTLQQQGFDYTYDKRLYDRLHAGDATGARAHLRADLEFQRKLVRFLENHDEPRAAAAFPWPTHQAAAMITFFVPGLRLLHEGQCEARRVRLSMHLGRRPVETADPATQAFYVRLLGCLSREEVRAGQWQLLDCRAAWEGNPTAERFIAMGWSGTNGSRLLVTVNYGPTQGQCFVALAWPNLAGKQIHFRDLMSLATYDRDGNELAARGLYLDLPPWGYHAFTVEER